MQHDEMDARQAGGFRTKKSMMWLIADERQVQFERAPPVDTLTMMRWLSSQPELREIPLLFSPGMRLYTVIKNSAAKAGD